MSKLTDEQILDDVEEVEHSYMEIYVRFNDDLDKDYCFQIKTTTTFKDLFKIFSSLPIALRPNLFYNSKPTGFDVCTSPGYLTEDGSILFDYETEKYKKPIKDLNSKVSDHVWPGQLILPKWEFNSFGFYAFISFLLVWLYTDLPDFISPTPGICLTNYVSKGLANIAIYFDQPKYADALLGDVLDPPTVTAQVIFFIFHLFKCLALFAILHFGIFNPLKLLRFARGQVKLEISREELLDLGWTGSKKGSSDDYKEFYRDYKIKQYGSMVAAHQAGLFDRLKTLGVYLGEGEGFNTPVNKEKVEEIQDGKVRLSYEYLEKIGDAFITSIEGKEGNALTDCVKMYRRYGLLEGSEALKEIVAERKKQGDSKL